MDLLDERLVKRWRRGRRGRDQVLFLLAERMNVAIERIAVGEQSGRLVVAVRPLQLELPLMR